MEKQLIVSICREFGSGGHEIATKVAEKLGLPFYDRNLLDEVADVKNVNADNLYQYDEAPKRFYFSRTVRGYSNSPEANVAELQFALLKQKAADDDSFVIVGRCSDEIFEGFADYVSIFITGDYDVKLERIMKLRNMSKRSAEHAMERHDRARRNYHNHFCKSKWGEASSYDLCINSSKFGIERTVDLIVDYIKSYDASR